MGRINSLGLNLSGTAGPNSFVYNDASGKITSGGKSGFTGANSFVYNNAQTFAEMRPLLVTTTVNISAGNATIDPSSLYMQYVFQGSGSDITCKLPNPNTITTFSSYYILNRSVANVSVISTGNNLILLLPPSSGAIFTLCVSTGLTANSWVAMGLTSTGYVSLSPSAAQTITSQNLTLQTGSMFATVGSFNSGSGAGGFSGNFKAFATTASAGSLSLTAANNSGNFANVLTNASTTASRTYTLPDSSGTILLDGTAVSLNPSADQTINGAFSLINSQGGFSAPLNYFSSGSAAGGLGGAFKAFPFTAAAGLLQLAAADSSGDFVGTLTNASMSADRSWSLPDQDGTVTVLGNTVSGSGGIVLDTSATLITPASLGVQQSALDMNSNLINNVTDPSSPQDAATKNYVDSLAQGRIFKDPCAAATVANFASTYNNGTSGVGATLTASSTGVYAPDGVTLALNDRVLIKDQTATEQNGIYVISTLGTGGVAAVLTRAADMNVASEFYGATTFITSGTVNGGRLFTESAVVTTVGTDPVTFVQTGDATTGIVNTGTANQLGYYATSGNTISGLTSGNNAIISTDASGVPAANTTVNFVGQFNADNLRLDGNTLSSTNTNGDIIFAPNGTGVTLVNTTTNPLPGTRGLWLAQVGASSVVQTVSYNNGVGTQGQFAAFKSRSGTQGTFVAVQNGDFLSSHLAYGDDGAAFQVAGRLLFGVDGAVSAGIVPGFASLRTANAAGVETIALTINSSQVAKFANPIVTSGINDASGNGLLQFASSGSAVNYYRIINSATGQSPILGAGGTDANISFFGAAKGTAPVVFQTQAASNQFYMQHGALAANTAILNFASSGPWTYSFPAATGTVQLQGQTAIVTNLSTAPANSASSTLAVGTAYQNTLGYDIVLTVYLAVTAATTANILLGVGSTNTPTQQTIISGLSTAALSIIPVTIYLPNQYYALLSTSGTITQTISGQQAMPV